VRVLLEQTREDQGHDRRPLDSYWRQVLPGRRWLLLVRRAVGRHDEGRRIWVSPVEVENALIEHPAVHECGIGARADHDGLLKPYAFVVVRQGVGQTPELAAELQQFVRSKLAEYKRPRWVEFIDELPKTATGKLQRYKLRERAAAATFDARGSKAEAT